MFYPRVLITGANGLLGQALVRRLAAFQHYDVLATGRNDAPRFSHGSGGYIPLDVTDADAMRRVFADFTPSVVINAAAITNVDACETDRDACWQVNVVGTENLVTNCKAHGSRLVHVSTDFVFDGEDGPYREEARPNPVNFYGRTKLAAENVVRTLGHRAWAIARTVLVFGTAEGLGRSNIALWVIRSLMQGQPIHVVTDQWRTPTYVEDLADGIERIIRFNKTGLYHLSGREFLSVHAFAHRVADVLGLDAGLIHPTDGSRFQQTAARPPRTGFIVLKAETELGYRPHPLDDAIADLARRLDIPVPADG